MGAFFEDVAFIENEDDVGLAYGGKAVGNDKGGAADHECFQRFLDQSFAFGIQRGGGFVQDEYTGVF